MHNEEKKESGLMNRVNSLSSSVHRTEREVRDVKNKEKDLEKKTKEIEGNNAENPFGELTGMHEIHMQPLMPHLPSMFDEMQLPFGHPHIQVIPLGGGEESGMFHRMHNLGDFLRSLHKTGPAAEHHMGPILPTGSIMTPGAHPKHLNEQKNKDKAKTEDKKDDKKENTDKKDEKKEESKPKSEGESHSV